MKNKKVSKISKKPNTTKKAIILIIFTSLCAGTGQLFLKHALNQINFINLYLFEWFFLYMIAIVLMTLAFKEGEISVLSPFLATSYVWVILVSPIFLVTESISFFKIIGSILIFLGVSLIGTGGRK